MGELLANGAAVVTATVPGGTAVPTVTSLPSTKGFLDSIGIYRGDLNVLVSAGIISGVCVQTAPETLTISPTSTKVSLEDLAVIRQGDSYIGSVSGTHPTTGAPCTIPVTIEVANAGQIKASGD